MKKIWILTVRTSLPEVCETNADLRTEMQAFERFEDARAAFRATLATLCSQRNRMFDSEGYLIYLDQYIKWMYESDEDDEGGLTPELLHRVQDAFAAMCAGKDVIPDIKEGDYTDWMIAMKVKADSIRLYGDDDGPCNGYDPAIATNAFSMKQEKDYYLYVDDLLGQTVSSELYMDLQEVPLQ